MATTENTPEIGAPQPVEKRPSLDGLRFDWIVTVLCMLLVSGVWLDNWAHNHGRVDNTFFTPWHAALYGAFMLVAAFLIVSLLRNHGKGYPWREALPPGYGFSLFGVIIFAVGGVLDMIWHLLFGFEVSLEILLSPTHIILAFGFILIVTGPLRAAWLRLPAGRAYSWMQLMPALLSSTFILSSFAGFTQYAHPQVNPLAAKDVQVTANLPNDLYAMNADGSLQIQLTNNTLDEWTPAWSHNGQRIAFASGGNGNQQIYVMNIDGSGQTRLTNDAFNDGTPAWSPDDSKIAFASDRGGSTHLYVMNADGSGVKRLMSFTSWKPAWSPDGKKIAFVSDASGKAQIYEVNSDGSALIRLTHTNSDERWPCWSPDGRKIVFASQRDGNSEIFVMNADGSHQVRLTNSDAWSGDPAWSPNGSEIAFVSYRDNNGEVYVMNIDGSHQVNLTNDPNAEDGGGGLSWSPDGRKIVYTVQAHLSFNPSLDQNLGLASILLQTAILMGIVLLLLRRWMLPFGAFTLMFTVNSTLISILNDQYAFILAAIVAGLFADLLSSRLKPSLANPVAFRVFAFAVPLVYYALYFLVLLLTRGVGWSLNLWMGSIVMAGIVGLLVSYLLIPPLTREI